MTVYWEDFDVDREIGEAWNRAARGSAFEPRREHRATAQVARRLPEIVRLAVAARGNPANAAYRSFAEGLRNWWRKRHENLE